MGVCFSFFNGWFSRFVFYDKFKVAPQIKFEELGLSNMASENKQNLNIIDQTYRDNQARVKSHLPTDLKEEVIKANDESNARKQDIIENMARYGEKLDKQVENLKVQSDKIEQKVEKKTDQTATGALASSWNPFKDKKE